MSKKLQYLLVAILAVIFAGASAVPAFAHHSFSAEFNSEIEQDVTGTITGVDWINPHVQMYLDVKGQNGQTEKWHLECGPTAHFRAARLKRDMFPVGQVIKVRAYMAKDQTKDFGWMRTVTFVGGPNDGKSYEMWSGGLDANGAPLQK